MDNILIKNIETNNIMTKSSLPVGGYSVNPYTGCTHACKYCYASFMKRFTGHEEAWGTFLDIKSPFVDNELPYGRAKQGHPVIVDYFYHEEVKGSENTGVRKVRK